MKLTKTIFCFLLLSSCFFNIVSAQEKQAWQKLPLESNYVTNVETTPWGIIIGENDDAPWIGRFNGVYLSNNYGESWKQIGLEGSGITDLFYDNQKIYATTKYIFNGKYGLFTTSDLGNTWDFIGPLSVGSTAIIANNEILILGTGNYGLWLSLDGGNTWEQKIGTGYYGPEIRDISMYMNTVVATTGNQTYISRDLGTNWEPVVDLANKQIKYLAQDKELILAGAQNSEGLFISKNLGETWNKVTSWGSKETGAITIFKNKIYVGGTNDKGERTVYVSPDLGNSWIDLGLEANNSYANIKDISWQYGEPSYIYVTTHFDGTHKLEIPSEILNTDEAFLEIPWETGNLQEKGKNLELVDSITSFFDHRYPLLGYSYHQEPHEHANTTFNFLGVEALEPELYYSSHNGTDFARPLGSDVLAAAPGYATYYFCNDCGHSIKINHLNGYETTYMHLDEDELITLSDIPVWVEQGQKIGKVGLTGSTTGPHIHVNVLKDINNDGAFIGDWPYGLVDPFGWQTEESIDPWSVYSWEDVLGINKGSKSKYLWNIEPKVISENINISNSNPVTIQLDNKKVTFNTGGSITNGDISTNFANISAKVLPYSKPMLENLDDTQAYLKKSSLYILLKDNLGNKISELNNPVKLVIKYSEVDLENLIRNSLKMYHWNQSLGIWELLDNQENNQDTNEISAETNNFSRFGVFGEVYGGLRYKAIVKSSSFSVQ